MKKNNKGFAYMKESERPTIVYGDSEQEILETLQKRNKNRTAEQQFVYCNIGTLDPEMDKYIRYQKYEVATGRNVSSLWLNIPGMSKEEFKKTIQEFKDKGARFHSVKKQWYISPDNVNIDYFKPYIEGNEVKEVPKEQKRYPETEENRELIKIMDEWGYVPHWVDGFSDDGFVSFRSKSNPEQGFGFDGWDGVKDFIVKVNTLCERYTLQELQDYAKGDYSKIEYGTAWEKEIEAAIANYAQKELQAHQWEDAWMYLPEGGINPEYDKMAQIIGPYEDRGYITGEGRVTEYVPETREYEIIQNISTSKERFLQAYEYALQQEKGAERESSSEYNPELVTAFQKVAEADSKQMEISKEKLSLLQELVKTDLKLNQSVSEMTRQILDAYGAEIRSLDTGNGTPWVEYRQPEQESVTPEEVTIDREDYLVSISRDAEDNRCTIYYKDGRLPVDLRGDQFNVHFPSSSEAHVMDIVQGYFENQIREYPEEPTNYEVGDSIDVYVPKWNYVENAEIGNSRISGLNKIKGTVESIEIGAEITYCVKEEQGLYSYVQQQEVYSNRQVEVLKRAIKDELSPDKFNLLANPELGSAQMEELRFAFKDGFSLEQVQDIAAVAKKSWQISLYRYGMQHGIKLDEIKGICANESKKWLECHQEVDNRIQHRRQQRVQELTSQGFQANTGLIKKLENIDHLTGKSNTLRDICNAFKEGTYEHTAAGEVIKSLGRELQHQELQMQAAMEPEP